MSDSRRPSRILVVDDDQPNVRLVESILASHGYSVLRAYDGEQALRAVGEEHPDLLLLDVMMPNLSGFEVCRRLRDRHETRLLPIIMITALNALEDKVQGLDLGADDFLSKPINRTELLAKVRSMLRVRSLQEEVERQKKELESANGELVVIQRFKESMTQMVVHDLKNPLAAIMGNIQLMQLQRAQMTAPRLGELLQRTQDGARQMARMIQNILEIAKLEENKMPLKRQAVDLARVVAEQSADLVSLSARDGIRLESTVPDDLPAVDADPELLGRILANLLSNAFKHTPSGGRIVVGASREGGEIIATVTDDGEGIPEDLQPHIFDKFVAGGSDERHRRTYDSGLGLTFCRLAVQAHGGRIWVKSRPGQGTTMHVALPVHGVASAAA